MNASAFPNTKTQLEEVAATLKKGGIAVFPTDTVYDLGCSIKHPEAVRRIFKVKNRLLDQSLPILISRPEVALEIAEFRDKDLEVLKKIWPGPWTLIVKARVNLPEGLKSPLDGTVALRCPDHGLALDILRRSGDTLAVSSANFSGGASPAKFEDIPEELLGLIDNAIDAGPCPLGGETAIARLEQRRVRIIRTGCVSKDELDRVELLLGKIL
jgi:L-threonylcarbamoyladenylate synthase